MLVISRKKNESLVIDENINIFIVEIRRDKVRLGIDIPKTTTCHRREVWDEIQKGMPEKKEPEEKKEPKRLNISERFNIFVNHVLKGKALPRV